MSEALEFNRLRSVAESRAERVSEECKRRVEVAQVKNGVSSAAEGYDIVMSLRYCAARVTPARYNVSTLGQAGK